MKKSIEGLIVGLILGVCLTIIILGTYENMQKTVYVCVLESFDNQNFPKFYYKLCYLSLYISTYSTMNHHLGKQVEIKLIRNECEAFTLRATKGL